MPGKSTYKKEGTFDYTQSKKDVKKKYKTDKETKSEVTKSNVVNFVKNRLPQIAKGMLTGAHQAQVLKKEGYLNKVGKVAPSVLAKCGAKRKH